MGEEQRQRSAVTPCGDSDEHGGRAKPGVDSVVRKHADRQRLLVTRGDPEVVHGIPQPPI